MNGKVSVLKDGARIYLRDAFKWQGKIHCLVTIDRDKARLFPPEIREKAETFLERVNQDSLIYT